MPLLKSGQICERVRDETVICQRCGVIMKRQALMMDRPDLDKHCDVSVAERDKDLMLLRLFTGREQRAHRLSRHSGTARVTPL